MGKLILPHPEYLVAISDIAEEYGVRQNVVHNWISRHDDFPKPLFTVSRGHTRVYDKRQVKLWYDTKEARNLRNKCKKYMQKWREIPVPIRKLYAELDACTDPVEKQRIEEALANQFA